MLAQFRTLAKSPIAQGLLGILLLSFVFFGIRGGFPAVTPHDAVVVAGDRQITSAQFKRIFDGYLAQVQEQAHQQVSVQDAVAHDLDKRGADAVADDTSFAELMSRSGVRPSDRLVVEELRKSPAFFDPLTGRFDKQAYEGRLAQAGLTDAEFERSLGDQIAQTHFVAGMAAALRAPLIFPALEVAYDREGRSFSYFVLPPQAVGAPVKPTDADLTRFMREHSAQLMRPVMRQLTAVHFSTAAVTPTMTADAAAVQKRFDFEKDSLSTPEKRSLFQVSVKDAATAATVAAKLKAGGDLLATAKAAGGTVLPYNDSPKSAIADKRVADAAFALAPGQVSAPIQGDLGFAVLKLNGVTPGHVATLDEARPKIEAEVKKDAAQRQVYQQVQKFDDARSGGSGLADAAKAAGAALTPIGPITAQGADGRGQPANLPPKVLQAAFSQGVGADGDVIDLGGGEYWALRVDKQLAPALPPLDELRAPLTQYYVLQDLAKRMQAKADGLADQLRKGGSIQAAAASVGATVGHGAGILRNGAGQTFSPDFLTKLFIAKPGEVITGQDVKLGIVVAHLEQVSAPAPADAAAQIGPNRTQVARALFDDMGQATRVAARALIKPKVDYGRARQALGVSESSAK